MPEGQKKLKDEMKQDADYWLLKFMKKINSSLFFFKMLLLGLELEILGSHYIVFLLCVSSPPLLLCSIFSFKLQSDIDF